MVPYDVTDPKYSEKGEGVESKGRSCCHWKDHIWFTYSIVYNVGLTILTLVGAIVEDAALKCIFFYGGGLLVPNLVSEGSMQSGCPCASG